MAHPDGLRFTDLQEACGLTDGNLNRHLHALAEMEIVTVTRTAAPSGRAVTTVRITSSGRERFLAYIDELESVVRAVQSSTAQAVGRLAPQS